MARQVLPIVGAVAGFVVGGPAGAQVGFALGSLIGNAVDPIEMQGNKVGDAPTQVAAEGGARAIVYGKGCIRATCIIERGGRRVVKQRDSSGGKGSGPTTVNERALWTYAIGLGEAIVGGSPLRIWEDEKLVYDVTPESAIPSDTVKFAERFRFYDGSETQLPDPAIEAIYSDPDDAPYYRGTAYLVFPQRDLTDWGERVPTYRVEVASNIFASPDSEWFRAVPYTGNGIGLADVEALNLSAGGMVIVARTDAAERPMIYFKDGASSILEMSNYTALSGAPGNPVGSSAMFDSDGTIHLPMNTSGASYMAYVFKEKLGSFRITHYTGNGVAGNTVAHGLGVTPKFHFVRQEDDPDVTLAWAHIAPFNGTAFVRLSDDSNYEVSSQQWNNSAPNSVNVTLGSNTRINANGRGYYLFAIGGDDVYAASFTTGSTIPIGFDPDFILMKRRGTQQYNWGALTQTADFWEGSELTALIHGSTGAAAFLDNRITRLGEGSYRVNTTDPTNWAGRTMDFLAIRGGQWTPGDPITLAQIVAAIHERCGHVGSDYNVTQLTDIVAGVVIEQTVSGAEAINSIIGGYFADPSDYDGAINYIKRGAPVIRTLTEDDLTDDPDDWQRNNAIEYPIKFHLFAQLADQAYAPIKATSSRYSSDIAVVGEASSQIPVTFDGSEEPYAIAAKMHKVLWTEANGEVTWPITDQHLDLVPTDCLGLSYRGQLNRVRIVQIEDTPGERKLVMRMDRQSAYTANLTAIPEPPAPTPPQPSTPSDTVLAILDTSALTDDADNLHMLVAMSGESDAWSGAQLQRSLDGGANYANVLNTTFNAVMGELMLPVSSASPYYTDTTNVVRVELYTSDDLDAQTQTQFLNYGGAFALSWNDSNGQQWELMQYRDATEVSPGVWELSRLMRGRKYTEGAEHPAGSVFVLLDAAVLRTDAQIGWIGTDLTHRAVSNGLSPETADEQTVEYRGNSSREWPVGVVVLNHDDPDVLEVDVDPRFRFGTNMNPIQSVNWQGLRITSTDGVNTETLDTTSLIHSFDVTGWGSPITVTVWQINRITGLSDPVTEVIP